VNCNKAHLKIKLSNNIKLKMGCACIQQDVVSRNQKISKQQSVLNENIRRMNSNNNNIDSNRPNTNMQRQNKSLPRNNNNNNIVQNSNNNIVPQNRQQNSNQQSSENPNNRGPHISIRTIQIPNPIPNQVIINQGEIFLQSKNNPNFNYPEIGK
jgi:hypothetical protein